MPSPFAPQPQAAATDSWLLSEGLPSCARLPEVPERSVPVVLNVYYPRGVDFDENGRALRRTGSNLTWANRLLKDTLGIYHVAVQVHGDEYAFGNWRAPNSRRVGPPGSGIVRHDPQVPGPQFLFKEAVDLGGTGESRQAVEAAAAELGQAIFFEGSYSKMRLNCADFALALCVRLGAEEVPLWCYRGTAAARRMGIGGADADEDSDEAESTGSPSQSPVHRPAHAAALLPATPRALATPPKHTVMEAPPAAQLPAGAAPPSAAGRGAVAAPAASRGARFVETPPPGAGTAFCVGQRVRYFSRSSKQWIPATVLGYNEEPDDDGEKVFWSYHLDVQAQAAPSHVSTLLEENVAASPVSEAALMATIEAVPAMQEPATVWGATLPPSTPEAVRAQLPASRVISPEQAAGMAQQPLAQPPVQANIVAGLLPTVANAPERPLPQPPVVLPMEPQAVPQLPATLLPAAPEQVPQPLGVALPAMQRCVVAPSLNVQQEPPHQAGTAVAYLSRSSGIWVPAVVQGHRWLSSAPGTLELQYVLDVHPEAEPSRVKLREGLVGVDPITLRH